MTDTFDLLAERWIPVRRLDQRVEELSLPDVLAQAHALREVVGDLPTQAFAIVRVLLAVLHRAVERSEPDADWADLWEAGVLPIGRIESYLERWRDRFDLLHPVSPFFQVADLRTAKGEVSGLEKLIADVPNGHQYFTVRAGRAIESISFSEAARWVVHAQAFDASGIKSGAVGDDRVKGGKGYPIGIAWAGNLGGLMLEGSTLRETLLLNLALGRRGTAGVLTSDDSPAWERGPFTAAVEDRPAAPTGPADLFTWQSRRVLLAHDDVSVTGVLLSNGDPLSAQDLYDVEPMTAWRRSPTREARGAGGPVYMPSTHQPDRALWRGLAGLLGADTREPGRESTTVLQPWVLEWAGQQWDVLGKDYVIRTRAVGMEYVNNASVVGDVVDDALAVHAHLVSSEGARHAAVAVEAVVRTDAAVRALGDLAANIAQASGGEVDAPRARAREMGYFSLDRPFREWLAALGPESEPTQAALAWCRTAHVALGKIADGIVADAGPAAWRGRKREKAGWLWTPVADQWFRRALGQALRIGQTSDSTWSTTTGGTA